MKAIVNGKVLDFNNDKALITSLSLFFLRHSPFQSIDTMKENFKGLFQQVHSGLAGVRPRSEVEKKAITSLKRKISLHLGFLDKIDSKESFVQVVYNFLLSLDGLSTLPGFGVCTAHFGDNLYINPEKQSMNMAK